MKFVAFLLLSSLTIVMVVAFPAPAAAADQVDSLVREPRHLLKYLLSKPVVVQPIVYQPVAVPRNGYPSYGYSNPYYGIRQY